MNNDGLWQAVARLSKAMQALPDAFLDREWVWRDHKEGIRFALLGTYHELRELAVEVERQRQKAGVPVTSAQQMLAQYHDGYRDLQAVLLDVDDAELDIPPAPDEWALRRVLGHIIGADLTFYVLVHFAVDWQREGLTPRKVMKDEADSLVGTEEEFEQIMDQQGLAGILGYYDSFHRKILEEASSWDESDLQAPSVFWEKEPLSVQYRLHRFDAHLRQHTVQAEKTLEGIGKKTNEARRLLRLVYRALAEIEGLLLGAPDLARDARLESAAIISSQAEEIEELVRS